MNPLDDHRRHLDSIDDRLLDLLAERSAIAREVAVSKDERGGRLRDRTREAQLLARVARKAQELGIPAEQAVRIFQEILNLSFHEQVSAVAAPSSGEGHARVGYQGVPGAWSEMAAEKIMSARHRAITAVGFHTFESVAEAVVDGRVDYGILPVENTLAGSINDTYDLLKRHALSIVGEEVLRVDHCLAGMPGAALHHIRRVYSHPQALVQCSAFLGGLPGVEAHVYFDTAAAMQKVAADQDPSAAAIGGAHAAFRYELAVLREGIADHPENYTRFLLVSQKPESVPRAAACKTSIIMTVRHEEGALLSALNIIHRHHINLTKLESRPRPGHPFEYFFYVDFEGNIEDAEVASMLDELRAATGEIRVLGSYVSRTVSEGRPVTPGEIRDSGDTARE